MITNVPQASACLLSLDIKKAYDSISHDVLIAKLVSKYKIRGNLARFIYNFLKERIMLVKIEGTLSDPIKILSGWPHPRGDHKLHIITPIVNR